MPFIPSTLSFFQFLPPFFLVSSFLMTLSTFFFKDLSNVDNLSPNKSRVAFDDEFFSRLNDSCPIRACDNGKLHKCLHLSHARVYLSMQITNTGRFNACMASVICMLISFLLLSFCSSNISSISL